MKDYYSLLGVRREASASEITATYRNILREKFQEAGYSFLFSDVTQAYRTLSNPQKRKDYDLLLQKVVGKYLVQNPNNPTPADKKYQSGLNAIEQKRFQTAVDFFTQAIKIDPEKSHFYSQLGLALGMFNGRLAEAERYCKKAIDLEPDNPELCYNLGFLYQRHNLVEAAQQAFLQAQQAEQKRWGTVFSQGNAVIELQWSEDEEELIKDKEPLKEELPEAIESEETVEMPGPAKGNETVETPTEAEITDDFEEPIILNDGPSMETADTELATEKINPESIPEKSQAESEITSEPISTEEAEPDDQIIMAQIIDGDQEYLSASEPEREKTNAPEIIPEIRNEPAGSETEPQKGLEIVSNAVDDAGPDKETLTGSDPVESRGPEWEHSQAEGDVDYGVVVDAVSPQAGPAEESGRDDPILKDLASLEAELAEVDASSGIGSGDNGLLMEMESQHGIIGQDSSKESAVSDRPRPPSEKTDEPESASLDDLEDEALSLLRELGLNPSEYAQDDTGEENPEGAKQEAVPDDAVEQSDSGDSEAEPDHDDLEELNKIEEMERKMAEELERLKQEREKLKKRKKKKK
jgi:tetratricopeptide (TPR) repeat protein